MNTITLRGVWIFSLTVVLSEDQVVHAAKAEHIEEVPRCWADPVSRRRLRIRQLANSSVHTLRLFLSQIRSSDANFIISDRPAPNDYNTLNSIYA